MMFARIRVAVSQRRVSLGDAPHDAVDRRWWAFLDACGLVGVPMPNGSGVEAWLDAMGVDGLLLTGGDDFGIDIDRDVAEVRACDWALALGVPIFGVCRGLQGLVRTSGGSLCPVDGHVGRHRVYGAGGSREVNSFHRWGIGELPVNWEVIHRDPEGRPEGLRHRQLRWGGVMHHPERELTPNREDVALLRSVLAEGPRCGR